MKTYISQIESEDNDRQESANRTANGPSAKLGPESEEDAESPFERGTRNPKPETASEPNIPHSALPTPHSAGTRTGKIARLPVDVRETVNRMLESGVRFNDIIKHLDELGFPGIHDYNISRWKTGGYQDWLAFKERLACAKVRADSARDLIRDLNNSDDLCQGNEILMATQLYEALLAPPPPPGTPEFDKHAKTLLTLSRALVTQMSERTRRDRIAFEKQRHHDKMQLTEKETIQKERQKRDLKEPLSQEETISIVHKVDQLFGIKIKNRLPAAAPAGERGKGPSNSTTGPDSSAPSESQHSSSHSPTASEIPKNLKHETRNPEDPSPEAPRAQFSAMFHHDAPLQQAPENPENEIVQRPCSVRVSPSPKSTNEPDPQPSGTVSPSENEKSQVSNYQSQIAAPTPKTAENPPKEDVATETPQDAKQQTQNSQQSRVPISPLAFPGSETPHSALANSTVSLREQFPCWTSAARSSIGSLSPPLAPISSTSSGSKIGAANTSAGSIPTTRTATRRIPNPTHVA